MVPDLNVNERNYVATLETICNIFEQLLESSAEKQGVIVSQDWESLIFITNRQNELLSHLELNKKRLEDYTEPSGQEELRLLRKKIKSALEGYQELERDNVKMLNDTLFVAREKVEKIHRKKTKRTTYSRKLKKDSGLWSENSVMLSQLV